MESDKTMKCSNCGTLNDPPATVVQNVLESSLICRGCGVKIRGKIITPEKIARLAFELGQSYERQELFGESIVTSMIISKDDTDLHSSQYPKEWAWEWWELREVAKLLAKVKLLTEEELAKFLEATPEK